MQHVLDEDGEHHGHEDGILQGGRAWWAPGPGGLLGLQKKPSPTSKPKTSWTEAPRVRMLWYAWLTKRKSRIPSRNIKAVARGEGNQDGEIPREEGDGLRGGRAPRNSSLEGHIPNVSHQENGILQGWPQGLNEWVLEAEILTDDAEVEKPGDVWAPFHLQEGRVELSPPQKKAFWGPFSHPPTPALTKSTRSSANQWKHLRKRRRVKRATKRGLKSSLKTVKAKQVSVTAYHERSRRCWDKGGDGG